MALMITAIGRLALRDEGQDLMEYGLLAALIALVAMAGVTALGDTIYRLFWRTLARPSDFIVLATVAAGAGVGAAIDLRTRRVPNPLTALLAACGVAAGGRRRSSGLTVAASLAGFVLGLALMLPGHLFGATGAGDVKFFARAGRAPRPRADRRPRSSIPRSPAACSRLSSRCGGAGCGGRSAARRG